MLGCTVIRVKGRECENLGWYSPCLICTYKSSVDMKYFVMLSVVLIPVTMLTTLAKTPIKTQRKCFTLQHQNQPVHPTSHHSTFKPKCEGGYEVSQTLQAAVGPAVDGDCCLWAYLLLVKNDQLNLCRSHLHCHVIYEVGNLEVFAMEQFYVKGCLKNH